MSEKIRKTIRIAPEMNEKLAAASDSTGQSENHIIEQALIDYFTDKRSEYERIADLFLERYDEKYNAYMTRVRLGTRTADVNSQVVLEVLNTILMTMDIQGEHYMPSNEMMHPVIRKAKDSINEIIRKAKQIKDNKKV